MKALIPSQPVAPANISQAGQPPLPPALGIARWRRRGIERLEGTALGLEVLRPPQKALDQSGLVLAQQAVELAARWQGRKRSAQMPLGIAVKAALAPPWPPLANYSQGQHLTARQRGGRTGAMLFGQATLAKIIHHHVQRGQEGVDV